MENQTQTTETQANISATQALLNAIAETILTHMQQMVDSRVERIMATQATAALFNDELEARIRTIAAEEAQEKVEELPDMEDTVRDEVASAMENIDIDDKVEHAFNYNTNWEEKVDERVDEQVEDAVDSALDNMLADKIDEVLEDRVRDVLIRIIKGE